MALALIILTPEGASKKPAEPAHVEQLKEADEDAVKFAIPLLCVSVKPRIEAGEFDGGALYLMGSRRAVLIAKFHGNAIALRPGFGQYLVELLERERLWRN